MKVHLIDSHHRFSSADTVVMVICPVQGQIYRVYLKKMAVSGALVFHQHSFSYGKLDRTDALQSYFHPYYYSQHKDSSP